MSKPLYMYAIVLALLACGCGEKDRSETPIAPDPVPTVSAFRQILEKRISSADGAEINVRQEVGKFENASDAEKRKMFEAAKNLAR